MQVWFETESRVRFKVWDESDASRWEVPGVVQTAEPTAKPESMKYRVEVNEAPFGIAVVRRSDGEVVFNSTPPAGGQGFSGKGCGCESVQSGSV